MRTRHNLLHDLPAVSVGIGVNVAILFVMHLVVLPVIQKRDLDSIVTVIEDEVQEEFVMDATSVDQVGTDGDLNTMTMTAAAAPIKSREVQDKIEEQVDEVLLPQVSMIETGIAQPQMADMTAEYESRGGSEVIEGGGVEGAMDRLTFELSRSLRDERTLAVWLFDASLSLKEERESIADRFDTVYSQLTKLGDTKGLYTHAAAFGEGFRYLADDPVEDAQQLVAPIRAIENDESGTERVFAAVGQIVKDYGRWRRNEGRWNRVLIIVTDEKGDDPQYLDEIIAEAKRRNFRIFCVGDAAVFGKEKAYVPYVVENRTFYLPRDAGPETAYPQLLDVAYWGGGDARTERMSAGYGPWALTRLCAETGGMFLVAAQGEGPTFDPAIMRTYAPDYRAAAAIEADLSRNSAVKALVQAATRSLAEPLPRPRTLFDAPDENTLIRQLTEAQKPFAATDYELRSIHETLERGKDGLPKIESERWKASFKLALGRILALRTRAYGYNAALASMKTPKPFENEGSNQWRLVPSETVDGNPQVRKWAKEAQTLLEQVRTEHAGTPWAQLAERELSQPFGWDWKERRDERLAILSGEQGEEAARLLLAEEEEKKMRPAPVKLPKL